jgi:hypothetical protein
MKNKMNEVVQRDVDSGRIKLEVKDRCFVCGRKIRNRIDSLVRYSKQGNRIDSLVRYSKQGNTCDECFTCSGFGRSTVPEKAERYKQWCFKLALLQNK